MKNHLIKFEQIMNGQSPCGVCFLLSDRLESAQRRRQIEETCAVFARQGRPYRVFVVPDSFEPSFCPSGEEVFFTDSSPLMQTLQRRGFPVAGYCHAANLSENLKASFLLEEPQEVDADSLDKIWQRLTGRPWIIAQTERLVIREMIPEDLDALYGLYEDPVAKRFLRPPDPDTGAQRQLLRRYIEKIYGFYGYGMWALCLRGGEEMIGRIGFEPGRGSGRLPELGYLVRADLRRQGLAREAAEAALEFAGEKLAMPAVCARTHADNFASAALLRALGFCEIPSGGGVFVRKDAVQAGSGRLAEVETEKMRYFEKILTRREGND